MGDPGEPWVLVVEDDHTIRDLLALMLASAGYLVIAVESGAEALAQLERRRFGLIVLDLLMPGQGGLDLLGRRRAALGETPVLVVTASGDRSLHDTALALGAREVLLKPFTMEELRGAVERSLGPPASEGVVAATAGWAGEGA